MKNHQSSHPPDDPLDHLLKEFGRESQEAAPDFQSMRRDALKTSQTKAMQGSHPALPIGLAAACAVMILVLIMVFDLPEVPSNAVSQDTSPSDQEWTLTLDSIGAELAALPHGTDTSLWSGPTDYLLSSTPE